MGLLNDRIAVITGAASARRLTAAMLEQVIAGVPMGRAGAASDVAGCALFLASDLSAYCTGTEVDVNGGSLIH